MSKYALGLAFIGTLLGSASFVQADDFTFYNKTDNDVMVHPNFSSDYCSNNAPSFMVPKKSSHHFDPGQTGCYLLLTSMDLTVPGNPHLVGNVHDLPRGMFGTYFISITEENNALIGSFNK